MRVLQVPVLAVVMAALTATTACHKAEAPAASAEKPAAPAAALPEGTVTIAEASKVFIEVAEIGGGSSGASVSAPAKLAFREGATSQVGAPLDGRVVKVHAQLGDHVKAGDALVTLECPDAAALRAARAVAAATLREAQLELERQKRMQKEGVGIERDVVAAETKVSTADAEVARVDTSLALLGGGTGATIVVRAPIAGVVTARRATQGLTVQRGTDPLVELGDSRSLWVIADVFERDLPLVKAGAKTEITVESVEGTLRGTVTAIGPVVASELRAAPVYVAIEAGGRPLRPGMFGRARIDASTTGPSLPVSAVLIKDGKDPVVYVQQDALTFQRRRVTVGQPVEGRVPVFSGLRPGDKVVVRGALLLDNASDQLL